LVEGDRVTVQRLGPSYGDTAYRPVSWRPDPTNAGASAPISPSGSTKSALATGDVQSSNAVPTVLTAPNGPVVYWKLVEHNRKALEIPNNTGGSRQPWYHGIVNMLFGQQLLDANETSVLAPFSRSQFMGSFPQNERSEVDHALRMFERANVIMDNGMQLQLTYPGYALRKRI